jgi:hypothetical protein
MTISSKSEAIFSKSGVVWYENDEIWSENLMLNPLRSEAKLLKRYGFSFATDREEVWSRALIPRSGPRSRFNFLRESDTFWDWNQTLEPDFVSRHWRAFRSTQNFHVSGFDLSNSQSYLHNRWIKIRIWATIRLQIASRIWLRDLFLKILFKTTALALLLILISWFMPFVLRRLRICFGFSLFLNFAFTCTWPQQDKAI